MVAPKPCMCRHAMDIPDVQVLDLTKASAMCTTGADAVAAAQVAARTAKNHVALHAFKLSFEIKSVAGLQSDRGRHGQKRSATTGADAPGAGGSNDPKAQRWSECVPVVEM